ncbi:hypothetical protein CFIMG_003489RA [Ceratocystis fimbriata CBS 114723]|uniref:Mitochondrial K+-H+ exchange-related-domain-containing protein n=1 Tax=Ceratocystis fimbriata CBS 114723 TaxID=1035309 RepID=A0A2C5XM48_9PEZI|nr:hypothetical protein CFIMG_003489RA [Ceratocystis fimbriata CBS 114723]
MRLFVLPVSTKRSLLYAQRFNATTTATNASLSDRLTRRANAMWASWEAKDGGWQKHLVLYGNKLLRQIPMEEWSLKSVPPLSSQLQKLETEAAKKATEPVEVVYPGAAISKEQVPIVLRKLATERDAMHRRRLIWCCIGMPIAVPFAVVPVIPNIPLFYLMYRAWSHWRALAGGKHVRFLLDNNLLRLRDSSKLDAAYTSQNLLGDRSKATGSCSSSTYDQSSEGPERLLLNDASVRKLTTVMNIPEVHAELDRAVYQVQNSTTSESLVHTSKKDEQSKTVGDIAKETNPAKTEVEMDKDSVAQHQQQALDRTLYRDEKTQKRHEAQDPSLVSNTTATRKPSFRSFSVKDVVDETDPAQIPMDKRSVAKHQQDVLEDTLYRDEKRQTQIEEADTAWTNHTKRAVKTKKDQKPWKKADKKEKEKLWKKSY